MADETQDWLTLWQTELAGMAADADWSARMARLIAAGQAFGPAASWSGDDETAAPPRPAAPDAASVAERLAAIERRLAALEQPGLARSRPEPDSEP